MTLGNLLLILIVVVAAVSFFIYTFIEGARWLRDQEEGDE